MKTINKEFLKKFNSYDKHIRPNPDKPLEVTITLLVQDRNCNFSACCPIFSGHDISVINLI